MSKELALHYQDKIRHLVKKNIGKSEIFDWLSKYPIEHDGRIHLFKILKDIEKDYPVGSSVLEQGAAEGLICKVLQEKGYQSFATDIEPLFQDFWDQLEIKGSIGDCSTLDWWDGKSKYNVIIAGVWVTCTEEKNKSLRIDRIRDTWNEILLPKGTVYFDIKENKYSKELVTLSLSEYFDVSVFMKSPRIIVKCIKK